MQIIVFRTLEHPYEINKNQMFNKYEKSDYLGFYKVLFRVYSES